MEKLIPAILEGKAKSIERTNEMAGSYQNCPYVAFMATRSRRLGCPATVHYKGK